MRTISLVGLVCVATFGGLLETQAHEREQKGVYHAAADASIILRCIDQDGQPVSEATVSSALYPDGSFVNAIVNNGTTPASQWPVQHWPLAGGSGITIKEVLYRNAALYDVCNHLRQVINSIKPNGTFTNISLVGAKHATASSAAARITLSGADASMWETLTNVCQQANASLRYTERHIFLVTSNTLDLPVFETHISYPLGTEPPAASRVERRVTAELALNHTTRTTSDEMPVLNTYSPLNAQVNIRSTRQPKRLHPRSGEIVYRHPQSMPDEQVELCGINPRQSL